MGWTGIPVYGKLDLKDKVKLAVESINYKVLEYSCKEFRKVMVAVQNLNNDATEVFELLFRFEKDEVLVKEFACGELFKTCPKKMIPYLEQAKDANSKKLLKATKEHHANNKNRLRLKANEYYVIPAGMNLSNGETAYVFQYLRRKLHSLGYRIDGGLRRRNDLVPVESLPTLDSIPKWLYAEKIGFIPGRGHVCKSCLDVTDRLTSSVYKDEMAAIHNDYVESLGDTIFIINDDAVSTNLSISKEALTQNLMEQRQKIIKRKKLKADVFDVFDNSDDFRDDHQERNEINEPHEQFKAGRSIEKKGVHEFQMTLF